MAINPTTIDDWLSTKTEYQQLEFKRAETQINQDDIFEYTIDIASNAPIAAPKSVRLSRDFCPVLLADDEGAASEPRCCGISTFTMWFLTHRRNLVKPFLDCFA